jgi:hypothetical protein
MNRMIEFKEQHRGTVFFLQKDRTPMLFCMHALCFVSQLPLQRVMCPDTSHTLHARTYTHAHTCIRCLGLVPRWTRGIFYTERVCRDFLIIVFDIDSNNEHAKKTYWQSSLYINQSPDASSKLTRAVVAYVQIKSTALEHASWQTAADPEILSPTLNSLLICSILKVESLVHPQLSVVVGVVVVITVVVVTVVAVVVVLVVGWHRPQKRGQAIGANTMRSIALPPVAVPLQ